MPVGMAVFIGVSVMFVRVRRDVDAKAFVIDQGVDEFVQIMEHGQGRGGVHADKGIDEDQADAPSRARRRPDRPGRPRLRGPGRRPCSAGPAGCVRARFLARNQSPRGGGYRGSRPCQAVAVQAIGCIAHIHLVAQHRVIGEGDDLGA